MEPTVRFTEHGVSVEGPLASTIVNEGFGTPTQRGVELDWLEAMYLLQKGKLGISADAETTGRISSSNRDFWNLYAVFQDLLSQGQKVVFDERSGGLVARTGEKRGYITLSSEAPLTVEILRVKAEKFLRAGWTPLLAIVDDHGTPTYYRADTKPPAPDRGSATEET
ncbi:MAG: hypothetical protein QW767_03330 [Thermoprotei archaeon]